MASQPSPSNTPPSSAAADPVPTDQLLLNLTIVSPSTQHVSRPLVYQNLPASTTVRQLKDKIRETLPLQPAPENQRLIYRGHPLHRDSDSLLEVFGVETVSLSRGTNLQVTKLLIRSRGTASKRRPTDHSSGHQRPRRCTCCCEQCLAANPDPSCGRRQPAERWPASRARARSRPPTQPLPEASVALGTFQT